MNTIMNSSRQVACQDIQMADVETPLLIDFDETLFLRNSTEEYLRSLQPRILALVILKILDYAGPWRIVRGEGRQSSLRDWTRVIVMTLLFPWTLLLWPKRARVLAEQSTNQQLIAAIRHCQAENIIIASNGFRFIIHPILRHMPIACTAVIACRGFLGFVDRRAGKKALLEQEFSAEFIARSILVTDSLDDQPLMNEVNRTHLIEWESSQEHSSIPPGYFPFFYIEKIKKPNQNFFVRSILIDEFIPLFLLLALPTSHPFLYGLGLLLLQISFWMIYEIGYMENDYIAEHFEANPTLSKEYHQHRGRIDFSRPWLWSLPFAAAGLLLWQYLDVQSPSLGSFLSSTSLSLFTLKLLTWGVFLLLTRSTYRLYNYVSESSRIWLYPILQALKFSGFLIFLPVTPLAVAYLIALVNSRWIPYVVYRCGGLKHYPDFPTQLAQFMGFIALAGFLSASGLVESFMTQQALVIFLLSAGLASRQLLQLFNEATVLPSTFFASMFSAREKR